MPATYTDYPAATDVIAMITEAGITLPSGMDATAADPYTYAAIHEWEELTRYRPFLAGGADADFRYDPPGPDTKGMTRGGGKRLLLDRGFVTITAVRTGVTADDPTGTLLVEDEDYFVRPANATPITMIEFAAPQWGSPNSVKVTGEAGHSVELTADVWNAVRKLAASAVMVSVREQMAQNPVEWKEADVNERSGIELIQKLGHAWRGEALESARRHMRWH